MKAAVAGAAIVAMAFLAYGFLRENQLWGCSVCHAEQNVRSWRFDVFGRSVTLTNSVSDLDSPIRQDFYPNGHQHVWGIRVGTTHGLFRGGITDGELPPEIVVKYNDDPEFRKFVSAEIAAGKLSASRLMQMFAMGSSRRDIHDAGPGGPQLAAERQTVLDRFNTR
jgi:hypothetical protein